MGIKRLQYMRICSGGHRYDPTLLGQVVVQAIHQFKNRERGHGEFKFKYNDSHPLTLGDLNEINYYVEKIWGDEEIYLDVSDEEEGL